MGLITLYIIEMIGYAAIIYCCIKLIIELDRDSKMRLQQNQEIRDKWSRIDKELFG